MDPVASLLLVVWVTVRETEGSGAQYAVEKGSMEWGWGSMSY